MFEAAIGVTKKWNAKEAGEEVASQVLEKLDKKPKCVLLYSTIHYEKNGGMNRLVEAVNAQLPSGTKMVGGTVAGFMCNEGSHTRGAVCLAIDSDEIDVATGIGRDTKRKPINAGKTCAKSIKRQLDKSKYPNKFLLNLIAGSEILEVPLLGRRSVMRAGPASKMALLGLNFSRYLLQKGIGMEEEVITEELKTLKDYSILHGSTIDDVKMLRNYQFFNGEVFKNSVVGLGMRTTLKFDSEFFHGGQAKNEMKVSEISKDKRIIHKLNGKPAAKELIRVIGWPEEFFDEKLFVKRFPYFPLGIRSHGRILIRPFIMVLGDSIGLMSRIETPDVCTVSISGRGMIDAGYELIDKFRHVKPVLGLFSECAIRLMALGDKNEQIRKTFSAYFQTTPFLLTYMGGEGIYTPAKGLNYLNETLAGTVFWR